MSALLHAPSLYTCLPALRTRLQLVRLALPPARLRGLKRRFGKTSALWFSSSVVPTASACLRCARVHTAQPRSLGPRLVMTNGSIWAVSMGGATCERLGRRAGRHGAWTRVEGIRAVTGLEAARVGWVQPTRAGCVEPQTRWAMELATSSARHLASTLPRARPDLTSLM